MLYDEKKPSGEQLGAPDTIFKGIPKGMIHNGGRIAFGPDRMLYAGAGETGDRGQAQDTKALGGKILRMTPDGDPAPGNPFDNSVVYSYGHRNVQGAAIHPETGELWTIEHGPRGGDEINRCLHGKKSCRPRVDEQHGEQDPPESHERWHDRPLCSGFLKPDFAKALRDYGESSADLQTGKWKLQVIRSWVARCSVGAS
jgi:hypothetical protein